MLKREAGGEIDALDVKIFYTQFMLGMSTIAPTRSLTNNIGHDGTGIHCGTTSRFDVNLPQTPLQLELDPGIKQNRRVSKSLYHFRSGYHCGFMKKMIKKNLATNKSVNQPQKCYFVTPTLNSDLAFSQKIGFLLKLSVTVDLTYSRNLRSDYTSNNNMVEANVTNSGENLIFLISQPRAGSTLLQRILAGHPEIHATAEPWLMLHPAYALRRQGLWAEYDACLAHEALEDFLKVLPRGQETYIEAIGRMYTSLYEGALTGTGKTYFLDKTPRYYFIISELYSVFPKAKYIILLRNPLAVLASILNTWVKGDWRLLSKFRYDLLTAPQLLLEGIDFLKNKVIAVHYEELVSMPEKVTRDVCSFLNLDFSPIMLEYGKQKAPGGSMGDPVEIHKHSRPVPDYADKWVEEFTSRQTRHFANSYLEDLGPAMLKRLGYSFDELKIKLASHKIESKKSSLVIPWKLLVDFDEHRSAWDDVRLKLLLSAQSKGILKTFFEAVRKAYTIAFERFSKR